jgi:hypothetical protein
MVTTKDILDAINLLLVKSWPDRPVHRGFLPKDFARPSFYILPGNETRAAANYYLLDITLPCEIIVFEAADAYGEMSQETLLETQTQVLELFASEKLAVKDRYLNLTASAGGIEGGDAYVDLQFRYFRARSEDGTPAPVMEKVTTKYDTEV